VAGPHGAWPLELLLLGLDCALAAAARPPLLLLALLLLLLLLLGHHHRRQVPGVQGRQALLACACTIAGACLRLLALLSCCQLLGLHHSKLLLLLLLLLLALGGLIRLLRHPCRLLLQRLQQRVS
jgi:hypothetical protein